MHARVAFFRLKSGSFEQVVSAVEAPGGLLGIFREQPGFQSYELIETGSGLVSVSHWDSSKQADAASRVAAAWATAHIDHLVKLQQSDVGEVVLSSLAPATAH
jgi:heme-degrading monooxygenase HmoA